MEDLQKTRDDLVEQIETLRRRLASLEVELFDGTPDLGAVLNPSKRSQERQHLCAKVELLPGFEMNSAEGINWSMGGLCIELNGPLRFRLRIPSFSMSADSGSEREADLMWFDHEPGRPTRVGFKFVD